MLSLVRIAVRRLPLQFVMTGGQWQFLARDTLCMNTNWCNWRAVNRPMLCSWLMLQ